MLPSARTGHSLIKQKLSNLLRVVRLEAVGEILPVSEKYLVSQAGGCRANNALACMRSLSFPFLCLVTLLEYARVYCAEHQQRIARSLYLRYASDPDFPWGSHWEAV